MRMEFEHAIYHFSAIALDFENCLTEWAWITWGEWPNKFAEPDTAIPPGQAPISSPNVQCLDVTKNSFFVIYNSSAASSA